MRINAVLLSYVGCNPTLSDGASSWSHAPTPAGPA